MTTLRGTRTGNPARRPRATPARCIPRSSATRPGSCPICGMALEPMLPTLGRGREPGARRISVGASGGRCRSRSRCLRSRCSATARRSCRSAARTWLELALATPVVLWAGWPFFRRWAAIDREPQSQHVDADRDRRRRRLRLQRRRDVRTRPVSGLVPRARSRRRLLRGRGDHRVAHAARAGARAQGAFEHLRGDQGAAASCAEDRAPDRGGRHRRATSRSRTSTWAIGCACGRARRCRSTAWSSRAAPASTSRC